MMQKSKFKIDWVLLNELAIGRAPKKKEHLEVLKNAGIKSIINLCSQKECEFIEDSRDFFIIDRYPLPDHRVKKLPHENEIIEILDRLKQLIKQGPVFVHCMAAMERSPLVCMAWLVREHNLSPQESLDYLMQVHQGTNPLAVQLEILKSPLLIK